MKYCFSNSTCGLGLFTHANAQRAAGAFLVDLNSRSATEIDPGTLGNFRNASGINDAGQAVGYSDTTSVYSHAFITGPDGVGMRDLGTLGGSQSVAYGINDAGQVVGYADTAEGFSHAFISPDGEGMVDLNSLVDLPDGVVLTEARGINNNGQVIAMGVIPEPETYALMLAGLGLIGFMGRRKKAEDSHS